MKPVYTVRETVRFNKVIAFSKYSVQRRIYGMIGLLAVALVYALAISYGNWAYLLMLAAPFLLIFSIKKTVIFPFGLYMFLVPFDSVLSITGSAGGTTITKLLGMLSICFLLLKGAFENKIRRADAVLVWWVLFIFFVCMSASWAVDRGLAFSRLPTAGGLLLLYLVSAVFKFQKEEIHTLRMFILAGGLAASFIIMNNFVGGNINVHGDIRTSLTIGNQSAGYNNIAFDLIMPLAFCIALLFNAKNISAKVFIAILSAVLLTGIVLTGSRGGMLGAIIILLIFLKKGKGKSMLGIVVFVMVASIGLQNLILERWGEAISDRGAGRFDIWVAGLLALKKYMIAGAGIDNFPVVYTEFASFAPMFRGVGRGSHNIYLGMFTELGIIGFSLMIVAMIKHYRFIGAVYRENDIDQIMLKGTFWAIAASSFFLDTVWSKSFWLFWMMIIMEKNATKGQA